MLFSWTMLNIKVILCKLFDSPRNLTDLLFGGAQPLQRNVVCSNLKFLSNHVAAKVTQQFDKSQHLLTCHRVLAFCFR